MFMPTRMPTPVPPSTPPMPRPADGRLDPIALAWYRYRIEAGHYDADDVAQRVAEYLHDSRIPRDEPLG